MILFHQAGILPLSLEWFLGKELWEYPRVNLNLRELLGGDEEEEENKSSAYVPVWAVVKLGVLLARERRLER